MTIATIEILQQTITQQNAEILHLKEQIAWLTRQIFGQKSERIVDANQEQLKFDGFESASQKKTETQAVPPMKEKNEHPQAKMPSSCPMIFR